MIRKISVLGFQNNGEIGVVLKTSHWTEIATNFIMTPFSVVLIAVAVLSTQVRRQLQIILQLICVEAIYSKVPNITNICFCGNFNRLSPII